MLPENSYRNLQGRDESYDLTVIIPAYNAEDTISNAIQSIRALPPRLSVQIIVVDDCSTDGTVSRVTSLCARDKHLFLIRQPSNNGAGAARNIGLAHAQGQYLAFLDADDCFIETQLENALALAFESKADVVVFPYRVINKHGVIQANMLASDDVIWTELCLRQNSVVSLSEVPIVLRLAGFPWNKLVNASYARKIGLCFSVTYVLNDVFANFQILLGAGSIALYITPVVFHHYDLSGQQLTNIRGRRRVDALSVLDEVDSLFDAMPERHIYRPYIAAFERDLIGWAYKEASVEHQGIIFSLFEKRAPIRYCKIQQQVRARKKIIIYGLGWQMWKFYDLLVQDHDIVGWMDSDLTKSDVTIMGLKIYHPNHSELPEFDFVVVCSSFHEQIMQELNFRKIGPAVTIEYFFKDAFLL